MTYFTAIDFVKELSVAILTRKIYSAEKINDGKLAFADRIALDN